MKKINIDKTILRFSNGNKINKRNVNINWLEKTRNFINIAYEDKINGYWWIKKFPFINSKTFNYNKNYGYDTNLYPGKSILNRKVILNEKTNKNNKIWIIYFSDYDLGYEFYNKFWKQDYIKIITGIDVIKIIEWINKLNIEQQEKNKKILMLKANVNQFRLNINKKFELNMKNFYLVSNLISSLSIILNKEIEKINLRIWDLGNSLNFIDKFDFEIIDFIKTTSSSSFKKINPIFFKVKTIRDILTHYYDHKILGNNSNYILIKSLFYQDFIYLLVVKNQKELKIYEYDFNEIREVLKIYLNQFN